MPYQDPPEVVAAFQALDDIQSRNDGTELGNAIALDQMEPHSAVILAHHDNMRELIRANDHALLEAREEMRAQEQLSKELRLKLVKLKIAELALDEAEQERYLRLALVDEQLFNETIETRAVTNWKRTN
ncbi:MAG TPA: hypothetical protein VHM25_02305 [Polyangiaceae bacterium]|jgi:hypothetical protein|nr:hypothetical protein [Polyangiaceae bacterium]